MMKNIILMVALSAFVFKSSGQTLQTVTDNGSTTSNPISINTGTEGLALLGNSYLSFKDAGGSGRNGYIQYNGSDLVMSADIGTIRLYSKVGVGTARAYDASTLHVKATNSSPWAFLTEASTNQGIIGMNHTGDAGVIAVSYLDDTGFTPLQLWTANIPRMTITAGGEIGIGTKNPSNLLSLQTLANQGLLLTDPNYNNRGAFLYDGSQSLLIQALSGPGGVDQATMKFQTADVNGATQTRMAIMRDGNVGIGITSPTEKLSVNGKIRSQEIKVENANWPDYVFTKDYQLPSLQQTEQHIKEKGHLPGIPSAEEVKANGIDLGEMNAKLLQKIEELTLHLIEQNKKMDGVQKENESMKKRILNLEKKI